MTDTERLDAIDRYKKVEAKRVRDWERTNTPAKIRHYRALDVLRGIEPDGWAESLFMLRTGAIADRLLDSGLEYAGLSLDDLLYTGEKGELVAARGQE